MNSSIFSENTVWYEVNMIKNWCCIFNGMWYTCFYNCFGMFQKNWLDHCYQWWNSYWDRFAWFLFVGLVDRDGRYSQTLQNSYWFAGEETPYFHIWELPCHFQSLIGWFLKGYLHRPLLGSILLTHVFLYILSRNHNA